MRPEPGADELIDSYVQNEAARSVVRGSLLLAAIGTALGSVKLKGRAQEVEVLGIASGYAATAS